MVSRYKKTKPKKTSYLTSAGTRVKLSTKKTKGMTTITKEFMRKTAKGMIAVVQKTMYKTKKKY